MFGSHAEYYLERAMAREITIDEALNILDKCEEEALVVQPFNAQNPGGMCNCCGDCCGILRSLKRFPKPALHTSSNFYAVVDTAECTGCETCLERCQMEAITVSEDGVAGINIDRCIGCGLCVSGCPAGAIELHPKPDKEHYEPPKTGRETIMKMAHIRGKSLIPLAYLKENKKT